MMTRGERISAIQRIGRALEQKTWADAYLTMQEFGLPAGDGRDYDGLYDFVVDVVRTAEDGTLQELDHFLSGGVTTAQPAEEERAWKAGSFRLFISHPNSVKASASKLADVLAPLGIEGFVAHNDVEPTQEWQDEIERALLSCDALCAILTPAFVQSRWCDQEVGMVVARRKLIIPLKVGDTDPHGFIGKYQAITVAPNEQAGSVSNKILRALIRNASTAEAVAPAVVRRYAQSRSFDAARAGFELLTLIPAAAWTPAMVSEVERAPSENTQVEHGVLNNPDGRPIPQAASELLAALAPEPAPETVSAASDDSIPF